MTRISRHVLGALVPFAIVAMAMPAFAQTGGLRGKVTDASGQPVEGAVVRMEAKNSTRKFEVKTNKKGEYVQIGLFPGDYKITATKEGLSAEMDTRVGLGDATVLDLQLKPAGAAPQTKEQLERNEKVKAVFAEGVAASQASNWDVAIAKFNEANTLVPNCYVCYYNLGAAYTRKEDLVKAEENYKKSVEIKPDYAEGWNALGGLYSQQKKFDLASAAFEKAAGSGGPAGAAGAAAGGNAGALFNQGVSLWNQGKFPEAKEKFDAATKADPKHGEAWFLLARAHTNLGEYEQAVAAFEKYLEVDPNGSHAADAKQTIEGLKPLVKK
jgi:tetratricopeptide (TPR) repeat protein